VGIDDTEHAAPDDVGFHELGLALLEGRDVLESLEANGNDTESEGREFVDLVKNGLLVLVGELADRAVVSEVVVALVEDNVGGALDERGGSDLAERQELLLALVDAADSAHELTSRVESVLLDEGIFAMEGRDIEANLVGEDDEGTLGHVTSAVPDTLAILLELGVGNESSHDDGGHVGAAVVLELIGTSLGLLGREVLTKRCRVDVTLR